MTIALLVSQVKDLVVSSVSDGKLDTSEILKIAIAVNALASSVVGLSSDEKKVLVVKVVEKAVKVHIPSAVLDETGVKVALQLLPTVLDIAVNAIASVEPVKTCFASCFSVAKTGALAPCFVSHAKKAEPVEPVEVGLQLLQPVSGTVTPDAPPSPPVETVAEVVVEVVDPLPPVEEVPVEETPVEETPVKTIDSDL